MAEPAASSLARRVISSLEEMSLATTSMPGYAVSKDSSIAAMRLVKE